MRVHVCAYVCLFAPVLLIRIAICFWCVHQSFPWIVLHVHACACAHTQRQNKSLKPPRVRQALAFKFDLLSNWSVQSPAPNNFHGSGFYCQAPLLMKTGLPKASLCAGKCFSSCPADCLSAQATHISPVFMVFACSLSTGACGASMCCGASCGSRCDSASE